MTSPTDRDPWPKHGPDFNAWNDDAARFVRLVQDNPGFWVRDSALKYLNVRIDTRSGHFVLYARDSELIEPDRVVAAIQGMPDYVAPTDPAADLTRLRAALNRLVCLDVTAREGQRAFAEWRNQHVATPPTDAPKDQS